MPKPMQFPPAERLNICKLMLEKVLADLKAGDVEKAIRDIESALIFWEK